MQRKVTKEEILTSIIAEQVVECSGSDNQKRLITGRDECRDRIDAIRKLEKGVNEEKTEGKNTVLYEDSIIHRSGQIENNNLTENENYVDLGDNPRHKVAEELNTLMKKDAK